MTEKNKNVDQFGTYSKNVGEWTTGSGGGAGTEPTHIKPENVETSTAEDAADDTNDITTGGRRDFEQQAPAGASGHLVNKQSD